MNSERGDKPNPIYLWEGKPHRLCDCSASRGECPRGVKRSLGTAELSRCLLPAPDVFPMGDPHPCDMTTEERERFFAPSADRAQEAVGPHEPPMVYDPKQGKMVRPGGVRALMNELRQLFDKTAEAHDGEHADKVSHGLVAVYAYGQRKALASSVAPQLDLIKRIDDLKRWIMAEHPHNYIDAVASLHELRSAFDGGDRRIGAAPSATSPSNADTERMNWLERMVVEARVPLVHGSANLFITAPTEVEGADDEPSDIRAQIDYQRNGRRAEGGAP